MPSESYPYLLCIGDGQANKVKLNNGFSSKVNLPKGTCWGDRGGPVIVQKNGSWTLAGIIFDYGEGPSNSGKCALENTYTLAMKTTHFLKFITDTISDGQFCAG